MTCRQLYQAARRQLSQAGAEPADAAALARAFLGLSREALALHGDRIPAPEAAAAFRAAVEDRARRRPLQYILGEWDFLGLRLRVGEGVLIPREDTAVLVEAVSRHIAPLAAPQGLDLCAGSGAVGLALCQSKPDARVTCVELSPAALSFLRENCARYPAFSVRPQAGDILDPATAGGFPPASLDFLAANPPYIATAALPTLQPEVLWEPPLALDGGPDGLTFYRALAALWVEKVRPGGCVAVEIGEEQAPAVQELFAQAGVGFLRLLRDWAGLPRCVFGVKQ